MASDEVPALFVVSARRWYDGTNTYHSVRVTSVDRTREATMPFDYGYGDQWKESAKVLIRAMGVEPNVHPHYIRTHCIADVVDVPRRRDLHNGGKL